MNIDYVGLDRRPSPACLPGQYCRRRYALASTVLSYAHVMIATSAEHPMWFGICLRLDQVQGQCLHAGTSLPRVDHLSSQAHNVTSSSARSLHFCRNTLLFSALHPQNDMSSHWSSALDCGLPRLPPSTKAVVSPPWLSQNLIYTPSVLLRLTDDSSEVLSESPCIGRRDCARTAYRHN